MSEIYDTTMRDLPDNTSNYYDVIEPASSHYYTKPSKITHFLKSRKFIIISILFCALLITIAVIIIIIYFTGIHKLTIYYA